MADLSRKERIPTKNAMNTRGNTRENTRESLKPIRYGHKYATPSKHKEIQDPNPTKDDTKVTSSSPRGGLYGAIEEGVLNPR